MTKVAKEFTSIELAIGRQPNTFSEALINSYKHFRALHKLVKPYKKTLYKNVVRHITIGHSYTPGSMNSVFSDFFQGMLEGYFRGCLGLFRGDFGRFPVET